MRVSAAACGSGADKNLPLHTSPWRKSPCACTSLHKPHHTPTRHCSEAPLVRGACRASGGGPLPPPARRGRGRCSVRHRSRQGGHPAALVTPGRSVSRPGCRAEDRRCLTQVAPLAPRETGATSLMGRDASCRPAARRRLCCWPQRRRAQPQSAAAPLAPKETGAASTAAAPLAPEETGAAPIRRRPIGSDGDERGGRRRALAPRETGAASICHRATGPKGDGRGLDPPPRHWLQRKRARRQSACAKPPVAAHA